MLKYDIPMTFCFRGQEFTVSKRTPGRFEFKVFGYEVSIGIPFNDTDGHAFVSIRHKDMINLILRKIPLQETDTAYVLATLDIIDEYISHLESDILKYAEMFYVMGDYLPDSFVCKCCNSNQCKLLEGRCDKCL